MIDWVRAKSRRQSNTVKYFVFKLGGSVFNPKQDVFDIAWLEQFHNIILRWVIAQNGKCVIVTGGGNLARKYIKIAKSFKASIWNQHKAGIIATYMNAHMIHSLFAKLLSSVYPHIVAFDDYFKFSKYGNASVLFKQHNIAIAAGGYRNQSSTDLNAIMFALKLGVRQVISIKGIDGIYSDDPHINKRAERFSDMTWKQYFRLIKYAQVHNPGDSWPIDPVAAKIAFENKVKVIVTGKNIYNIYDIILGNGYTGTIVA